MGCIGSSNRDELLEEIETLKESLSDKELELKQLEDNDIKIVKYVGVRRDGEKVYLALGCKDTVNEYDSKCSGCEGHRIKDWDGHNRGVLSDKFPSAPLNKYELNELIDILIDCCNEM